MNGIVKVLVAEDQGDEALLLKKALAEAKVKFDLHFVCDGQEVVEYLEGQGRFSDRTVYPWPNLLLLDLKMPRMTGFDVLEWLRKRPDGLKPVVVVLSGSDDMQDVNRAYELGATSYLVKPFTPAERVRLLEALDEYWRRLNFFPSNGEDKEEAQARWIDLVD